MKVKAERPCMWHNCDIGTCHMKAVWLNFFYLLCHHHCLPIKSQAVVKITRSRATSKHWTIHHGVTHVCSWHCCINIRTVCIHPIGHSIIPTFRIWFTILIFSVTTPSIGQTAGDYSILKILNVTWIFSYKVNWHWTTSLLCSTWIFHVTPLCITLNGKQEIFYC